MVAVTMNGLLEPITLEEGFTDTMHVLNNAAAQGKEFVVATEASTGDNLLLKMSNILVIREQEDFDPPSIG